MRIRKEKYFRFLQRSDPLPAGSLRSPSRARISVKRRPKEPTRRSKFRGGAFCPRDVLHLLSFCQRPPFLLRSSYTLLSFAFPSRYRTELTTREDGGKRIIPVLSLSLPFCLLRSSRSTSEPTIRSLASLVLSRDNGSSLFVGSAR